MSTLNPLFLDSTKPIGDKVVTNVELLHVFLRDGDTLYFEVTDQFGFVQRFAMKIIETKKSVKYTAEVWLKYQHQIQYRFLIVSDGAEVYSTAFREARAGHVITEKWEPVFDVEKPKVKKEKRRARRTVTEEKPVREIKTASNKSFCKPHLFEQIQSLIEDLL